MDVETVRMPRDAMFHWRIGIAARSVTPSARAAHGTALVTPGRGGLGPFHLPDDISSTFGTIDQCSP